MGDVVYLPLTKLEVPPKRVLECAIEEEPTEVIVIATTKGGQFYFAASSPYGPDILWALERARGVLLKYAPPT